MTVASGSLYKCYFLSESWSLFDYLLAEVIVGILSEPTCWSVHFWGSGKWEIHLLNSRNPRVRVMDVCVDWWFLFYWRDCWICDQDVLENRTYVRPFAIASMYGMFTVFRRISDILRKTVLFLMTTIVFDVPCPICPDEISHKRGGFLYPLCSKCSYFQVLHTLFLG